MASPVVEKLGQIITKQTAASPDHARALLMAAYSWVNLAGRFPRPRNVRAATERVNGGIEERSSIRSATLKMRSW